MTKINTRSNQPCVSFIIPLYNCLALTQVMLKSLRASLPAGLAHEIIFVDDGSTDGTRTWLATLDSPPFRVILNERNLGYAAANNRGAALARSRFLVLLNSDLALTPHWLEPMLDLHARFGTRAGLIGNVQRDARTGAIDHSGIFINAKGKPQHDRTAYPFSNYRKAVAVTGACLLVERALWTELGGFDENFVNGCEDVDLCLRARAAGRINAVALRSVVGHHVSASPGRKLRDEENTRRLTLRWRKELAQAGLVAWCRNHISRGLNAARADLGLIEAAAVLACAFGLRKRPPLAAIRGMEASIDLELERWRALLGPVSLTPRFESPLAPPTADAGSPQ
ncbi:MAG: glycosyltransferase family 2 protein [Verrucomicrobiota bacterium]|nr:glycosyltransferase family 2 protein [Verrucomicrobiota bacterium]